MERRGIFGDRRVAERREARAYRPEQERRSGGDRRGPERRAEERLDRRRLHDRRRRPPHEPVGGRRRSDRAGLPPLSRLIPALVVVAITVVDLAVAQLTSPGGWGLLVVGSAIPIAAVVLVPSERWRWHLAVAWFAVGLYLAAAAVHVTFLLAQ